MDIDLAVLRMMEREREIPFDELVQIIEQAILTAYLKHTDHDEPRDADQPQPRVELDRKTGHVTVYVPEFDDEGMLIGEAPDSPDDFGRIAAFAAKQVINQRLRDIGDDRVLGEFKGREGDIVARYGGDDGLTIYKRSQFVDPVNLSNKTQFYYICLAILFAAIYFVHETVTFLPYDIDGFLPRDIGKLQMLAVFFIPVLLQIAVIKIEHVLTDLVVPAHDELVLVVAGFC